MTVAFASWAARTIMSATASTSVSRFGSQPESSQTMCVPSAFNYRLFSSGLGWEIPPPGSSSSACRTPSRSRPISGLWLVVHPGARERPAAMARRARRPLRPNARADARASYGPQGPRLAPRSPKSGPHNTPPPPWCKDACPPKFSGSARGETRRKQRYICTILTNCGPRGTLNLIWLSR